MKTKVRGHLQNYGEVWHHPKSLVNILSLASVRSKFRVTLDTSPHDSKPTIQVHFYDGKALNFVEHKCGIYVHEVNFITKHTGHVLVHMISDN